ncbi:unnamed protein product [Victoria cruziana]
MIPLSSRCFLFIWLVLLIGKNLVEGFHGT